MISKDPCQLKPFCINCNIQLPEGSAWLAHKTLTCSPAPSSCSNKQTKNPPGVFTYST